LAHTPKAYRSFLACTVLDPEARERHFKRRETKVEVISQEAQKLLDAVREKRQPQITAIFNHMKNKEKEKSDGEIAQKMIDEAKKGTLFAVDSEENRFTTIKRDARKVIVVGDVQGAFDQMIESLLCAGAIRKVERADVDSLPEYQRYEISPTLETGTEIVFIGDYFDRGPKGMEVLQFVMKIKEEAETDGRIGVNTLVGNHEIIWLKLIDLMGNKPQAEIDDALTIDGCLRERTFESLRGTGLERNNTIYSLGLAFIRGKEKDYRETYKSILRHYEKEFEDKKGADAAFAAKVASEEIDLWRYAVSQMKEREIPFIKSLKAVVVIDDLLFTHAGPVFSARNLEELNAHYERTFGNLEGERLHANYWGYIMPDALEEREKERLFREGDYSCSYAFHGESFTVAGRTQSRTSWTNRSELSGWLVDMKVNHMYVGHEQNEEINVKTNINVTNVDGGLCKTETDGTRGGIVVIDPFEKNPIIVAGESRKNVAGEKITDPKERVRDISEGISRDKVIENVYSRIAKIIE
jgi:hypothetical protein